MKQNIRIESAGLPDIPQIMQIIEEACQQIENPDWYSVDDQAFMEAHIERNGFILKAVASGEESMDEIAGFLVVRFPGNAADNLGKYLALPEEEMERVAHMESAAVRSAYRGLGLQNQLMQYAEKMLEGTPYIHLLGTAHPDNCYSVRNFERLGYAVIAEDRKYGGLLRHVFYKKERFRCGHLYLIWMGFCSIRNGLFKGPGKMWEMSWGFHIWGIISIIHWG